MPPAQHPFRRVAKSFHRRHGTNGASSTRPRPPPKSYISTSHCFEGVLFVAPVPPGAFLAPPIRPCSAVDGRATADRRWRSSRLPFAMAFNAKKLINNPSGLLLLLLLLLLAGFLHCLCVDWVGFRFGCRIFRGDVVADRCLDSCLHCVLCFGGSV